MRRTMSIALVLLSIPAIGLAQDEFHLESRLDAAVQWHDLRKQMGGEVNISVEVQDAQDTLPVVAISMERETVASEGRGFLGLKWQQRQIANMELIQVGDDLFIVASAEGQILSKAPLGEWHVEEEGPLPDFYTGPRVGGVIRGNPSSPQ